MGRHLLGLILCIHIICARRELKSVEDCYDCNCCMYGLCTNRHCLYGCIDGIMGAQCLIDCKLDCGENGTCYRNTPQMSFDSFDICEPCPFGKYRADVDKNDNCTEDCPGTCKSCSAFLTCEECHAPYYNTDNIYDCSSICPSNCKSCLTPEQCLVCNYPFVNRNNTDCTECVEGMYGSNCENTCPKNCHGNSCDQQSGACLLGCVSNFRGEKCTACLDGFHGKDCNYTCSFRCKNGLCDQRTGGCFQCIENFEGYFCEKCTNGRYLQNCSAYCKSPACAENKCHQNSGNCFSCIDGLYGELCDTMCSHQCLHRRCNFTSGICELGCTNSYSGDRCCVHGPNCQKCSSDSECSICSTGFYGKDCEKACPGNCHRDCDRDTGICQPCSGGKYGAFCNMSCPITCVGNGTKTKCNITSGLCFFGCEPGFYGTKCEHKCSLKCNGSSCDGRTGACVEKEIFNSMEAAGDNTKANDSQVKTLILSSVLSVLSTAVVIVCVLVIVKWFQRTQKKSNVENSSDTVEIGNVFENLQGNGNLADYESLDVIKLDKMEDKGRK